MVEKVKELVFGRAKNPLDSQIFHKLSLIAFLAWVGLGADGLSSSAYGPEETYKALGAQYHHIALFLALMMMATVFIISASYSQIIEYFPSGGGGYVVASKLLSPVAGLVSGSALIVDYILTIATSIAAGMDAIADFDPHFFTLNVNLFFFVPTLKLAIEVLLTVLLIWLNMRGIKESVMTLLPIFLIFVGTHVILILAGLIGHGSQMMTVAQSTLQETHQVIGSLGFFGFLVIFFKAYSLGGGTYTGIEAVSNGLANLREPRVQTGKKTMLYMAVSLAFTAGGILILYMLWDTPAVDGETMNGTLSKAIFGPWASFGQWMIFLTLLSEGMLLFIAAQTGFIDGPNVLSNMAVDSWMPHRFANLSHRLVRMNGILAMGIPTLLILIVTKGDVDILVLLYAINVYITFSMSQLSMCVHWWRARKEQKDWRRRFFINGFGLCLTSTILVATVASKFLEGGFMTLLMTGALILFCLFVKRHYMDVRKALRRLDDTLINLPLPGRDASEPALGPCEKGKPVAVIMVESYNGLGIHAIFSVQKLFGNRFQDILFVSIGRVDSSKFKGVEEMDNLRKNTEDNLRKYVALAHKMGYRADYRYLVNIDVIAGMEELCDQVAAEFSDATFFSGKLIFAKETLWSGLLHNQTSLEIQRRLLFKGINMMVVPVRIL